MELKSSRGIGSKSISSRIWIRRECIYKLWNRVNTFSSLTSGYIVEIGRLAGLIEVDETKAKK